MVRNRGPHPSQPLSPHRAIAPGPGLVYSALCMVSSASYTEHLLACDATDGSGHRHLLAAFKAKGTPVGIRSNHRSPSLGLCERCGSCFLAGSSPTCIEATPTHRNHRGGPCPAGSSPPPSWKWGAVQHLAQKIDLGFSGSSLFSITSAPLGLL